MSREKLSELYDLLEEFYWKYPISDKDCELVSEVQEMISEQLKVSDCWNIRKAG